jgi:hypothetical protein
MHHGLLCITFDFVEPVKRNRDKLMAQKGQNVDRLPLSPQNTGSHRSTTA